MKNRAPLLFLGIIIGLGLAYLVYKFYPREEKVVYQPTGSEVINVTMPEAALKDNPTLKDLKVTEVNRLLREQNTLHLAKEAQNFFTEKDDTLALRKIFLYVQTDCPTLRKRCETKTKLCLIEKETAFAKSLNQKEAYCVAEFKYCEDRIIVQAEISEFTSKLKEIAKKDYDRAYALLITFLLANKDNRKDCEKKARDIKECEVFSASDCKSGKSSETTVGTFICQAAAIKCINESY